MKYSVHVSFFILLLIILVNTTNALKFGLSNSNPIGTDNLNRAEEIHRFPDFPKIFIITRANELGTTAEIIDESTGGRKPSVKINKLRFEQAYKVQFAGNISLHFMLLDDDENSTGDLQLAVGERLNVQDVTTSRGDFKDALIEYIGTLNTTPAKKINAIQFLRSIRLTRVIHFENGGNVLYGICVDGKDRRFWRMEFELPDENFLNYLATFTRLYPGVTG